MRSREMIKVDKVVKKYASLTAVNNVSFTIGKGNILGLLGQNGAGKTSLLRLLTGYHYPQQGAVYIDGISLRDDPVRAKSLIGYLPELPPLYPEFSVYDYLSFIARSHGLSDRKKAITRVLDICSLDTVTFRTIDSLSKGYRQRLGLAQAIIHDPDIVILDEPINGLDPQQIIEIRSIISELGRTKTVILSSHIMQEIEAICKQIIILHEGSVVAEGTVEEVSKKMRQSYTYYTVIKGRFTKAALKELEHIPSVLSAEEQGKGKGGTLVQIISQKDIAEKIFDWTISQGYKILQLSPKHVSLEEVFTTLTQEKL